MESVENENAGTVVRPVLCSELSEEHVLATDGVQKRTNKCKHTYRVARLEAPRIALGIEASEVFRRSLV